MVGLVEEWLTPNIGGQFAMFLCTFELGVVTSQPTLHETRDDGHLVKGELEILNGDNTFLLMRAIASVSRMNPSDKETRE
jgi:hypothetical protein